MTRITDRMTRAFGRALGFGATEERAAPLPPGTGPVWLRCPDAGAARALEAVIERLAESHPDHRVLITAPKGDGERVLVQPEDHPAAIARFLDRHRPVVAVLCGDALLPATVQALRAREIPMIGAMLRPPAPTGPIRGLFRAPAARLFTNFETLLAEDIESVVTLRQLGAPDDRLALGGVLAAPVPVPAGDQAEQDSLTELMSGRPVWCAVALPRAELPAIAEAHRLAQGRSHRLLLVVVPARPEEGEVIQAALGAQGILAGLRSEGEDPVEHVPAYVADIDGEIGLWLRLSPVAFLGGTLSEGEESRSPMEAASLGSAILHGPETGAHAPDYARLAAAGAAREVANATALASEIDRLSAPDQAAEMAHAGWEIASAGDQAADMLYDALVKVLDRIDAADPARSPA